MVVTSVINQNNKKVKVYIDNNFCFSADYKDIKRLHIEEGRVIDNNQLRDLVYECQYNKSYNRALRLLSIKSRTEYELRKKLLEQDYDKEIIDQVITRMKDLGYVNDAEYTKMWVEEAKRMKPSGRKKLVMGLCNKGIDPKLANEAVDDCNLDDFETATEILNRRFRGKEHSLRDDRDYGKMYRYLIYKGIGYGAASKAIKLFFKDNTDNYFD